MKMNTDALRSPVFIFVAYVAFGSLIILGFRYIFPGEIAPLPIFSKDWRLIRGLIDIIALFPALAFSALVVPFGLPADYDEAYTRFSPHFFQRMVAPIVTVICAAGIYSLLFFLALPVAKNFEGEMRFRGELYRMAKEEAQTHGRAGEWIEASQYLGICDSVWEESPELASLRTQIDVHLDESRYRFNTEPERTTEERSASISALPGQRNPVDAVEALALGEAALNDGRFLDAHWLATLGGRIAREGSVEAASASRLAARAWNQIESQQPTPLETRQYSLYQLKLSAYQAMVSGDWIRAFYLFQELFEKSPHDPDAENFLAACEKGTKEIAFFIEEMGILPGETNVGVIFSLPSYSGGQGRSVMRVGSLTSSPDYAYATGIEYMAFDSGANLLYSLQAPYAKFLPITFDGRRHVLVQMRALDRHDASRRWEPEWEVLTGNAPYHGAAQITLGVSYETFLMLAQMRQELSSMQISELFTTKEAALGMGYIPEVFEAEILNRLSGCLFFLPMAVIALLFGWRFRARRNTRYIFIPLLPVLPVVFNGLAHIYKAGLNIIGASLVIALGFSTALTLYIVILVLFFLLSLILLASQHS